MNWTDYQQAALSFVAVEGDLREYVAFGLLSEVGEVAGVYAKRIRGDKADVRERLLSEFSDVAWFIAVGAACVGLDFGYFERDYKASDTVNKVNRVKFLLKWSIVFADQVLYIQPGDVKPYEQTRDVISTWARMVLAEGFTVSEVLEYNIAKLTARQAAGTIRGSGDNR